jgi:predicted acylesterase/phospholipase RssA
MRVPRRDFLSLSSVTGLAACGALPRLPAVPEPLVPRAEIPGIPGAKFYADENDAELSRWLAEQNRRSRASRSRRSPNQQAEILVLSGGGEDGAFGAGLLTEWTHKGDRPEFRIVTGVSTGALTAPFAFLGRNWDRQLEEVYTTTDITRVLAWRQMTAALFDDALGDSSPLAATIARYVDEEMLAAIADAYASGRALLIGTTDRLTH